jgi:DNA-binding transcriptional MerR regulator
MRKIMTRSTLLTSEDLIDELDMGKATLKFILHRFSPWLVTQIVDDETYYTEQAVTILLKIKKLLDTGILPEQIEDSLTQEAEMLKDTAKQPAGNQGSIPMDIASTSMFKDMFAVYIEKQDRIALAQEALARVEARKADAMEKRAAAEEKKAAAMTNIALALQEMNQRHSAASQTMELVGRAVETMALEESPGLDESLSDSDFDENMHLFEDPVPMEDLFKDEAHEDSDDIGSSSMDDLSLLVNETALTPEDIDDLSDNKNHTEEDLDDLFSLVDIDSDIPKGMNTDLDDLSKLIEHAGENAVVDLDDLSALIGNPEQSQEPMDDLSLLVDGNGEQSGRARSGVESQVKGTPSIKPNISPNQDIKKYKAAIMKIIIELKGQGLTAQQTTDRLNRDDVATLSGKPAWGLKAVDKIYGFIDSAK